MHYFEVLERYCAILWYTVLDTGYTEVQRRQKKMFWEIVVGVWSAPGSTYIKEDKDMQISSCSSFSSTSLYASELVLGNANILH